MSTGPLLIFLHLPKTAGSTLVHILEREYGSSGVLALYDSFFGEELVTSPPAQLDDADVIIGHFYFGVHTFVSRPAVYVTMLRDPVDRVISHYHYVQRNPEHYLYASARTMSLEEYVVFCGRCEPNNDQTRLLAGKDLATSDGTCSVEMLPAAIKNLYEHFAVVGITEDFDRSLILMKHILRWRSPYYLKQNVSPYRFRKPDISLETIRTIWSYNELDYELYSYARERLREQISLQGDLFEREVGLFQLVNNFNGKLSGLARRIE